MHGTPEGFHYIENYLTQNEHDRIWEILQDPNFVWDSQPQRRQVKQYGYYYNYRKQELDLTEESLPDWLFSISKRLKEDNLFENIPDHVIINKYLQNGNRNWSIAPHIDSPNFFGPIIASITIGNACTVEFCSPEGEKEEIIAHKVESRSLYSMSKQARYDWYHRIPDKKYNNQIDLKSEENTRISLTFRTVRREKVI